MSRFNKSAVGGEVPVGRQPHALLLLLAWTRPVAHPRRAHFLFFFVVHRNRSMTDRRAAWVLGRRNGSHRGNCRCRFSLMGRSAELHVLGRAHGGAKGVAGLTAPRSIPPVDPVLPSLALGPPCSPVSLRRKGGLPVDFGVQFFPKPAHPGSRGTCHLGSTGSTGDPPRFLQCPRTCPRWR